MTKFTIGIVFGLLLSISAFAGDSDKFGEVSKKAENLLISQGIEPIDISVSNPEGILTNAAEIVFMLPESGSVYKRKSGEEVLINKYYEIYFSTLGPGQRHHLRYNCLVATNKSVDYLDITSCTVDIDSDRDSTAPIKSRHSVSIARGEVE